MNPARRRLLKFGGVFPASISLALPAYSFASSNAESVISTVLNSPDININYVEVRDQLAAPMINKGDYVLMDSEIRSYQGEDVYFYPDWGQPQAYLVKEERSGELSFFYPGQNTLLWTMAAGSGQHLFAGQMIGVIVPQSNQQIQQLVASHEQLLVSALPMPTDDSALSVSSS